MPKVNKNNDITLKKSNQTYEIGIQPILVSKLDDEIKFAQVKISIWPLLAEGRHG